MIQSIKIKIGEKEIELTLAEAKALRTDLDSLLGLPTAFPYIPLSPTWNDTPPYSPTVPMYTTISEITIS